MPAISVRSATDSVCRPRRPTAIPAVCRGWDVGEGEMQVSMTAALAYACRCSPPPVADPNAGPAMNLYERAYREAERHKWLVSERQGYDAGEGAIREWYATRWPHFCRACQLQHVAGRVRWDQFDPATFGTLHEAIASGDLLADRILDRVDAGWENLHILLWAREWGLPMKAVLTVLERIDVNRARLDPNCL
ncbi:hypothetical protein [Alienimonas californiensis]|nr:hypothetical protein [Alienimonas californiensis]